MAARASQRPGIVTFAAIFLFVIAGLHAVYAISEFADRLWELEATNGLGADDLWIWGIIDSVFAVGLVAAGVSVLRGGAFGAVVGVAWAAIDAMRWLYWVPAHPLLSVVAIVIDGIVIYALTVHYDWSATLGRGSRRGAPRRATR